jgi:hypothetical protein
MTLRRIRCLLYLKNIKVKQVAEWAGVSPTTASVVLTGRGKSKPIQAAVAELLGKPYEKVWGRSTARKAA